MARFTQKQADAADHYSSLDSTLQEEELYDWTNSMYHTVGIEKATILRDVFYKHMKPSQQNFMDNKAMHWSAGYYACCALRGGMPEKRIREIVQLLIG